MTISSWIYLIGWPVITVLAARLILEGMARDGHRVTGWLRFGALVAGGGLAVLWPFWAPFAVLWLVAKPFLTTSHERRAAERAELARLRKQARELGLPLGPLEDRS